MWNKLKDGCTFLAQLAAIVGVVVLAWQATKAVGHYERSLESMKIDRSAEWITRLVEPDSWRRMVTTHKYLRDPSKDAASKIRRIEEDSEFESDVFHFLAELELLAYMYNTDRIDRDLVRRGPSAAVQQYFDGVKFWIDHYRTQKQKPEFYRELEIMVDDFRRTTASR